MATARKPPADPLKEELPPATDPQPKASDEVKFEVQIAPYVAAGEHFFRWTILDHNHKGYVGDYSGHSESGFDTAAEAEFNARDYVRRVRHAVDLKLNAPESVIITL